MVAQLRNLFARIAGLFRGKSLDSRLDEELNFHIEMQVEDNLRNGMNPGEARKAALRSMGGIDRAKEKCRDVRSLRIVGDFFQDLRFGVRMFYRKPKFVFAAVIILALAIGPNTAVFSIIQGVQHRYMPYPDPERIVEFNTVNPKQSIFMQAASFPDYRDFADNNLTLESLAFYHNTRVNLSGILEPVHVQGIRATASLFGMLKRFPALGRVFSEEETKPGADPVIVISHDLWERQFSSDPDILGKTLSVNAMQHTIIGIMPEDFIFPEFSCKFWLPFNQTSSQLPRSDRFGQILGRLAPGVSLEAAQSDLSRIAAVLQREYPDTNDGYEVLLDDYSRIGMPNEADTAIPMAYLAVTFVLMIACANISTLLLAKATGRRKELSIRASLGGSRMRILRQLLTENMLLAFLGGILGIFTAYIWIRGMLAVVPADMPNRDIIGLDFVSLAYTIVLAFLSSLVFSILPAFRSTGRQLIETLKESYYSSSGRNRHRLLNSFIISEIAMTAVLLIAAGILIRSYQKEISIDPGFDSANLLTIRLELPESQYTHPEQLTMFVETAIENFKNHMGTEMVAAAQKLPLMGGLFSLDPLIIQEESADGFRMMSSVSPLSVTPGYFRTMRLPLHQGRYFNEFDNQAGYPVAIINETTVKRYLADASSPLGQKIKLSSMTNGKNKWMEVVGVVGDTCAWNLKDTPLPEVYIPYARKPSRLITFVARTDKSPMEYAATAKSLISSIDPDQPVRAIQSMDQIIHESVSTLRAISHIMSLLSVFALVLAALGIYSVISYAVSERTNEIGIRLAFGAQRSDIFRMVLNRGLLLLGIGMVIGVFGALASMKFLQSLLFGVTSGDPVSYAGTTIILVAAGLLAMIMPVRRAMSVDPMTAIRHE